MAKAKKKPKHFWVTRDADHWADYRVHRCKRSKRSQGMDLCANDFESFADPSVHLKPSGGPIKVMLVRAK